ncbi:MAG: hypothetical protein H3C45_06385 [Bacteroidia bacterium]|nr:hypothetical protein [Bacteroidia bacterium]MCC7533148.1 hypothetical protein [Bacteroidia bacterium]
MLNLLYILLQFGPPDPDDWGDPDELPISDNIWILVAFLLLLSVYKIYTNYKSNKSINSSN